MQFQCSKCGACCRRAGKLGLMPQRADGACIHLAEDNTCKIYATRPDLCNMETMFKKRTDSFVDKKAYFKFNSECCNVMIKEDGMDDKYLIDIGKYDQ